MKFHYQNTIHLGVLGGCAQDEDLMACLKDAVGNEQLAAAIKLLHSGPQRKSPGLPTHPSEGFMQRLDIHNTPQRDCQKFTCNSAQPQ